VTGQARVTMAASDGTVLLDATVKDAVAIPPRTAMIGVQAGGDAGVRDGLAGWHEASRLARMNARVAVGPGCTLQIEGVVSEAPPTWLGAGEIIAQATAVTTHFTGSARTIAVVLAGSDTPSIDGILVELDGATRVAEKGGEPRAPRVVMAGRRAVLLYDVKPARNAAISVRVQSGGPWRLSGVMAGDADSETLARTIATTGAEAVAGRLLLAADGAPVSVTWEPPERRGPSAPPGKRGAGRRPAMKKAKVAKKSPVAKKPAKTATKKVIRKTAKKATNKTTKKAAKRTSASRTTTRTRSRGKRHAR
jgi:hypothetical protein